MRHDSFVGDQLFPRENRISLGPHRIQRAQSTMGKNERNTEIFALKKKKRKKGTLRSKFLKIKK